MKIGLSRKTLIMLLIFTLAAAWTVYTKYLSPKPAPAGESGAVRDVDPSELAELVSMDKPGILELYTTSCPWCAKLLPELERVQSQYKDDLFVVKMNAEKYPSHVSQYGLRGVPTMIFFDESGVRVLTVAGYRPYEDLVRILKQLKFVP